jgi:hypothetical protein
MFITPIKTELPPIHTGGGRKVNEAELVDFLKSLLEDRGAWFAFWSADVSNLTSAKQDSARGRSRRIIDAPRLQEHLKIQGLKLQYATRKKDGILTAYARII